MRCDSEHPGAEAGITLPAEIFDFSKFRHAWIGLLWAAPAMVFLLGVRGSTSPNTTELSVRPGKRIRESPPSRVEENQIGNGVQDLDSLWNASNVNRGMRFIGTDHDVGIRCRRSVGQALSVLRSYLPLVNGIIAG